jgi:hypothetical protein
MSLCQYRRQLSCPVTGGEYGGSSNECAVPHLAVSVDEALAAPPNSMYWNVSVTVGSVEWIKGNTATTTVGLSPGQVCECGMIP